MNFLYYLLLVQNKSILIYVGYIGIVTSNYKKGTLLIEGYFFLFLYN